MQSYLSKNFRVLSPVLFLTIAGFFSGCYHTQFSSLQSYNGPLSDHGTNQCFVAKTALDSKFTETINKYKDFIQGDSHIESESHYEIEEAAFDCMYVGAKSVMILERGVTSTNSGTTFYTYKLSSGSSITHSNSSKNSAYTLVFFNKKIPEFGKMITMDEFNSWIKSNNIKSCEGCK